MKGQMFIVTMIFLVGLIFFVQQTLFGYTALDLSDPFQEDDYYIIKNIEDGVDEIIGTSSTCEEADEKIWDFIEFVRRQNIKRGIEPELGYRLNCSAPFPPE